LVILDHVNTTSPPETVWFTTKGQVVIPLRLRKLYHIEDGTRAIVTATDEGILLKPVTAALIKRGRGIAKRKPDDKPFDRWWAEYKGEEKALEEAKYARCTGPR
jgi:AbrB family looped-hinge helix DNA binding protein